MEASFAQRQAREQMSYSYRFWYDANGDLEAAVEPLSYRAGQLATLV